MLKRFVDIVVGALLGLLALPVIALLALACAVQFRCWPFFVQQRVGWRGKPFRIVKLRTLAPSAPRLAHKFDPAFGGATRLTQKLRNTHLDELPQLLLVPLGKMSLVGPRPEMAFLHDAGDAAFARARVAVRPGCTGLWQVSVAAKGLIWESPEYDLFYLEHASIRLDLWIFWQTLLAFTPLGGPKELSDVPAWARRPDAAGRQRWMRVPLPQMRNPKAGLQTAVPSLIDLTSAERVIDLTGTDRVIDLTSAEQSQARRALGSSS